MSFYQKLKQANANTAGRYSNFVGQVPNPVIAPSSTLSQINRTYRIKIVSVTNTSATYVIGGYNYYGDGNSAGSTTDAVVITTNVLDGTHAALKREMQNMSSTIAAVRMRTSNDSNFNNSISYSYRRGTQIVTDSVEPLNAQSPTYNQSTIIDLYDFAGVDWNGTTQISGTIDAGTTITFAINIGSIVDMSNANSGQNVVQQAIYAPPIQANVTPVTLAVAPAAVGPTPAGSSGM